LGKKMAALPYKQAEQPVFVRSEIYIEFSKISVINCPAGPSNGKNQGISLTGPP